jgi:mannosylglycoprotein endo-beta-mannosidase
VLVSNLVRNAPREAAGSHFSLHFGGINYTAEIWVNAQRVGEIRGAFLRGDFDNHAVRASGRRGFPGGDDLAAAAPWRPHEHTMKLGVGLNGSHAALDGPTLLSTNGWDWLVAVRDRDAGIWLPVTLDQRSSHVQKFVRQDQS